MSYILDALKKSEQERQLGAIPTLGSAPAEPLPAAEPGGRRWLLPLLAANLLLVTGLLFWLLLSGESVPPVPQAAPLPPSVPAGQAGDRAVVVPEPPPLGGSAVASAPVAVPPAAEDPPRVASAAAEAPLWEELPAERRHRITPPRLDVHVYSENPARRFVLINERRYREGQQLPGGMLLEEITADGAVLSWQGEYFRISGR